MEIEEVIELANELLVQKGLRPLSDIDCIILRGAWNRQTYEEIAAVTSYSVNYLRKDVGNKLWRDLTTALEEPLSKTNFRAALERHWVKKQQLSIPMPPAIPQYYCQSKIDCGEAIDVSIFFGRSHEQAILRQWLTTDRCRFILLLGMGGIGKTALSIKVAQQVQSDFEFVIWRSLRNAPPILDLLADLIKFCSQQQDVQVPTTVNEAISYLFPYLRDHRCLLMLDNAESILQAGDPRRSYRPDYEGYGQLFQKLCETPHLSCLLVTSRELPKGLESKMGQEQPVRSLTIGGLLSHDGQALLTSIAKFQGSATEWEAILQRYAGNPLALKIVASFINEVLVGDLSQFLAFLGDASLIFDDIRDLLSQQFLRLSVQEQAVMIWLAIKREPLTLATLSEDLLASLAPHELLQVVMALQGRALLEKTKNQFTLQPVVMEYVTDYLIEHMSQQICFWHAGDSIHDLSLLREYALLQVESQEYISETQIRLILNPLLHKLLAYFRDASTIVHHFQQILAALRGNLPQIMGYGAGNIINLLRTLQVDLTGFDFSHLTLRQANLQGIQLHHVDFSNADLSKTRFTQTFSGVVSLAFSPDGQYLASGDTKCNIVIWRLQDGQASKILAGHKNWVSSLTFSPDGLTLVSSSIDCSIRLWDVETGQCTRVILGHESLVYSVTFSPDQQKIASGSDDHTAKIWDTLTGECLQTLQGHSSYIRSVAFNTNSTQLITGSNDHTIRVWDLQSGQTINTLSGPAPVWSAAISPNGELVVSGSADQTARVWNLTTGKCLQVLQGHSSEVWAVAFSPNGLTLASAGLDRTVRVWDVQSGQCLHTLQGHTDQVWSVIFHPNGQHIASGGLDQTIRLWNLENAKCTRTWYGYINHIYSVAFSRHGTILASGGDDALIHLWDWQTGSCTSVLTGHTSSVWTVVFHPNNRTLAAGGFGQTIRLWDLETQQCLQQLQGLMEWILCLVFHPSGQLLASSSLLPIVLLWDVNTGQCVKQFDGHRGPVWSVAFSPDGYQLVSASADQCVKLWDVATGECLHTMTDHHSFLHSVKTFLPSASEDAMNIPSSTYCIASAGADQTIKIWNSQTGACMQTLEGHTDWIYEIAIHPSGKHLASASHDSTVRLWDLQTGDCLAILPHDTPLWSVTYHPEGNLLATCGWNNRITIWDIQSETIIQSLELRKPYHGMILRNCKGLTSSQQAMLKDLGAIA